MPVALAQKVEALRVDFRSAARLADLLGVSRSQVTRWLRGAGIDPLNAQKVDLLELVWSNVLRIYDKDAALEWLEARAKPTDDPPTEYSHFVDDEGRRKLLYYTARHMEKSCIACHNHPDSLSPKKDWNEGDVVGVLKIVRPLEREIDNTQAGLRSAFLLMGAIWSLLLVISVAVTIVAQYRRKVVSP